MEKKVLYGGENSRDGVYCKYTSGHERRRGGRNDEQPVSSIPVGPSCGGALRD